TPIQSHLFQVLFRFESRQAFVPKDNRCIYRLTQFFGEPLYLPTLGTLLAIHVQGVPDYDLMHFVFLSYNTKGFDIRFYVFAAEGGSSLRGQEKGVTDGHTNGFVTNVESHNPHIFHDTILKSSSTLGGFI